MRFIKLFSFIFIALFIILIIALTITYSARVAIINKLVKTQPNLVPINVSCLNISLAGDLSLIIDKLCLQTAKADIEIINVTIQWQYTPQIKITDIKVNLVNIKGTTPLFANAKQMRQHSPKQSDEQQSIKQLLLTTLRPYIKKISQFKLPININITKLSYLPFTKLNKTKTLKKLAQGNKLYIGKLSIVNNNISFSLRNANNITFIKVKLSKNKTNFSVALASKLHLLKTFAMAHQLPITTVLQKTLNTNELHASIDSLITYQDGILSIKNKITNIAIKLNNGIGKNGTLKLLGSLNFQSRLKLLSQLRAKAFTHGSGSKNKINKINKSEIELTLMGKNEITLEYNQPQFIALLEQNKVSPTIISMLNDNPLNNLTLTLQNKVTLTLTKKKIALSQIRISARGGKRTQQIKLNNIIVYLRQYNDTNKDQKTTLPTFSIAKFVIDSQLNLADNWGGLDDFISEPITLHLEGSLKQNEQQTVVNLNEKSSITVNNIAISKASTQKEESTAAINTENILRLKTLTTSLNGSVKVLKNSTISLNLKLHSQASHVNIQPVLQLKSLDFFSDVKGNFDDIQINTTVQADGIDLGNIELTGAALTPKIVISATKLSLTDLLSLNIKLPTKVALIDGLLTYRISGQLANLTAIENTALSASIAITSVSGKINGLWLQDLNWQQNFTLHKGKITTQANDAKNLTIELIDSSIPIAKLSMNTHLTLNKDFKLYVNELKGNILGGSFYIPAIQWPLKLGRSVDVQLTFS